VETKLKAQRSCNK